MMEPTFLRALACGVMLALAACHGGDSAPGMDERTSPFDGIEQGEVIRFTGTEPFWGGQVAGSQLTYTTPENIEGTTISVSRFAGNHGLGFSGQLAGQSFDMTVTPGKCGDGMSDRSYPLTVTLRLADELREGCGWTDRQPFSGPANP